MPLASVSCGGKKNKFQMNDTINIEIIRDSESLCDMPSYFDYINEKYTYVNGTGTNLMNISLKGGSVGSLE